MIPVLQAVKLKGCTRAAIVGAIQRGEIDAERFGKMWAIVQNTKFEQWQPSERHQDSGRARWASVSKSKPKTKRKA